MIDKEPTKIHGMTGEIGRDGILSPDQRLLLNTIQQRATDETFSYFEQMQENDPFPLIAMATGIGKGNIIHRIIERQVREKPDSKVLIVAGTKLVLVDQTHQALAGYQETPNETVVFSTQEPESTYEESEEVQEVTEETANIEETVDELEEKSLLYKTGKYGTPDANVHIATIQTLQTEAKKGNLTPEAYDLVLVDEVHNVGTKQRIEAIKRFHKVVGLTATPYRSSGQMKRPEDYGFSIIESLSLPEAQELRLLPPLCGIQIDTKEVVDEIPAKKNGAINYAKLEKILKKSPYLRPFIADRIAPIISSEGRNYKTVIAVNFVWEAQELAELLNAKGLKVGVAVNQNAAKDIHTDEVPAIGSIDRYKLPHDDENSIQVLISPYVAGEGFDAPATEVLVWASPTDSPLRYTQYTGRLARRVEGKLFGVVVDCLYQTDQYNWSYNFGMWMKGDVQQLDNGLLWLGPESDIATLQDIPVVQNLREQTNQKSISELQKNPILELQENDFPVIERTIKPLFYGEKTRLMRIANQIVEDLRKESPHLVVQRKRGSHLVTVITDPAILFKEIEARGIQRFTATEVLQEGDLAITQTQMRRLFIDDWNISRNIAREVIETVSKDLQDFTSQKKIPNGKFATVINNRELFLQEMVKRGMRLREDELKEIQNGEIAITGSLLESMFIGAQSNFSKMIPDIVLEIEKIIPNITSKRKSGTRRIFVIPEEKRQILIETMLAKGFSKREIIEDIQEGELSITGENLHSIFVGIPKEIKRVAHEVIQNIETQSPELVGKRRNKNKILTVVKENGKELFMEEMLKKGFRIRQK